MQEAQTPPDRCGICGAPRAPRQEYCLECGSRTLPRTTRAHWVWPSLLAVAVAAGGGAVAIAASGNAGSSAPRTIVATQALVPVPPARKVRARAPATPKPPLTPAPRAGALVTWPGGDRYTIVLSFLPARSGVLAAKAKAEEAVRAGLQDVGVLVSSSYSGLHPGYYVVFSGIYESLGDAQSVLPQVTPRFPSAHAQQIVR